MIYLEPCPFCGQEPEQRNSKYNPYARCATDDCMGGKLPLISLDVPDDIERWNRRGREQALEAHVEAGRQIISHGAPFEVVGGGRTALAVNRDAAMNWERTAPTTSLARLKAQCRRDVVTQLAEEFREAWPEHNGKHAWILGAGDEICRQAEGGDHD